MRRKRKYIAAPKCDWCGVCNENFVVTANKMYFCREQIAGYPATKDCHTEYLKQKELENVRKENEKKRLQEEEKERQKEKIKSFPKLNKKLEEFYNRHQTPKNKRTYL